VPYSQNDDVTSSNIEGTLAELAKNAEGWYVNTTHNNLF
jgi:hypothetical protein